MKGGSLQKLGGGINKGCKWIGFYLLSKHNIDIQSRSQGKWTGHYTYKGSHKEKNQVQLMMSSLVAL